MKYKALAHEMEYPTSDWGLPCESAQCSWTPSSLSLRLFGDEVVSGAAMLVDIPDGAKRVQVRIFSRAETVPVSDEASCVDLSFYVNDDLKSPPQLEWRSGAKAEPLRLGGEHKQFVYRHLTFSVEDFGLVPGEPARVAVVRDGQSARDTLVGDWELVGLGFHVYMDFTEEEKERAGLKEQVEEAMDEVDAMFFTGDAMYDSEILKAIETYLARWNREAERIKKRMQDVERRR